MKLFFCQNDPLMGEPFWQNNSLVSHILFELQPIIIFSPVANFSNQSLDGKFQWSILNRNWESQFRNRSNEQLITLLSRSEVQIDIISINDRFNSNFGILNREGGQ